MDKLTEFFGNYGWACTLIAIIGIAILGVLKYCNLFKSIGEGKRHYIYLAISIGLTLIATAVYLLCVGNFSLLYYIGIAIAVFTLNQTFYNIFKVTPINSLFVKLLDIVKRVFAERDTDDKQK